MAHLGSECNKLAQTEYKRRHDNEAQYICCGSLLSLIQILFPLFQTHYNQITITKTTEIKFEPRIKLNHNISTDNFVVNVDWKKLIAGMNRSRREW